jgi:hypothetical protein
MSFYTYQCPCGSEVKVWFGDRYHGQITTSLSSRCENCGAAWEGDDRRITGNLRVMHLEQEGTWGIQLSNLKDRIWVLKIMREEFNLPMNEAQSFVKTNNDVLTVGTKAEACYVQDRLRPYNVKVSITQVYVKSEN